MRTLRWTLLVSLGIMAGAAPSRADEVIYWNNVALDIMKQTATPPPKVSRDLAIVHAAIYDALNAIDQTYAPLYDQPPVVGPASREAAVAAAAYQALVGLYPVWESTLAEDLRARLAGIPDSTAKDNGVALGKRVADHILALRAADRWGADSPYNGSTEPGKWRPTAPGYQPGLAPHGGNLKPFALPNTEDFRPGPPPGLNCPEYTAALEEVRSWGGANSTARTPDQTQIAHFWSDSPGATASPPGKWNLIAQTLSERQHNTLAENARLFALLNLALADAGIVCWNTKYTYEFWRPVDAIHLADADGNPDTSADPNWSPLLTTPPFPEYMSGHSTFSGAAARILSLFVGTDDIPFATAAGFEVLPGVTRSFPRISAAAQEAGISRVYGGIHFGFSNREGLACGARIADYVFAHYARESLQKSWARHSLLSGERLGGLTRG